MESMGKIMVNCDSRLYGKEKIELNYFLHTLENEDFSDTLKFVQTNYKQLYDLVLEHVFAAYSKNTKWDIWDESTQSLYRIFLKKKEDVHLYVGVPTIDIMRREDNILLGLSFWEDNRLSIEHGLCAIFDNTKLLLIAASDFENIVYYWDYYIDSNLIK